MRNIRWRSCYATKWRKHKSWIVTTPYNMFCLNVSASEQQYSTCVGIHENRQSLNRTRWRKGTPQTKGTYSFKTVITPETYVFTAIVFIPVSEWQRQGITAPSMIYSEQQECIPVGCVPVDRWPYSGVRCFRGGVYLPGGVPTKGGCTCRGVYLPGGYLPGGVYLPGPGGVYLPGPSGGCTCLVFAWSGTLPPC